MYIGYYWENYIHLRAHAYSAGIRTKVNKFVQGIGNGREGIMEDYTTNVNGTAVIGESRVKTAGTKKRGVGKDVFLLVLIVFIAVSVLTGLTVAKSEQEVMPAESAIIRSEESVISFDEDGNIVYESGAPEGVENDPFFNAANIEQDEAGNVTVTEFDGTVTKYESGSIGVAKTTVNLDEDLGIVPASSDQFVGKALEERSKNIAYATSIKGTKVSSASMVLNYNKNFTYSAPNSSESNTSGKGGSASATAYSYIEFTAGTWTQYFSRISGKITTTVNSSSRGYHRAGWSSRSTAASDNKNVSGNTPYFVFYAYHHVQAPKKERRTASVSMYSLSITLKHSCSDSPKITKAERADGGKTAKWMQRTNSIIIEYNAGNALLQKIQLNYPILSSTTSKSYTKTYPTGSSGVPNVTLTGSTFANTSNIYPAGDIVVQIWAYNSSYLKKTLYAKDLHIDNDTPVFNEMYFVKTNGKTDKVTGPTNAENLYMYVKCYDRGGKGAASGVKTIELTSDRGYKKSYTVTPAEGKSATYWLKVPGKNANGKWSVKLYDVDNANNSSKNNAYSFYHYDGVAPTVSDLKITAKNPNFTYNNVAWTNDNLIISFKVTDYAVEKHVDNATINTVSISYKVNGVSKEIKNAEIIKEGSNNVKTCTYNALMYDYSIITDFTILVKDKANNGEPSKLTPKVEGRLDTIAPSIQNVQINSPNPVKYTWADIGLSIKVRDFDYSETGTFGNSGKRFNNGSGISKLYFYTDAACTKPLKINNTDSNIYSCTDTYFDTLSNTFNDITIVHDTANSAFGGDVYVVAEDKVGNRSDGRSIPSNVNKNETWGTAIKSNVVQESGVYLYEKAKGPYKINRDTFVPQIVVKSTDGKILASTMKLSGTTLKYVMPWENVESQKIVVDIYYGGSGGEFTVLKGESTIKSQMMAEFITGGTDYNFKDKNTAGTGEAVSVSSTEKTSYSSGKKESISLSFSENGESTYTIQFVNGANKSSDTISFTTRIDSSAPTVTLLGFSNENVTSSLQFEDLIPETDLLQGTSHWIYPDNPMNGLWGVFKVDDAQSGTLMSKNGELLNGTREYGIDGKSETQYTKDYAKAYECIDHSFVNGANYCNTGYRMEFKYDDENGNVYSYELTGYTSEIDGSYYVVVNMFDTNKLKTLPGLYDATQGENGVWNVKTNTYLRYKIGVSDFIGNIGYANLTDSRRPNNQLSDNPEWDNRVLRYYVDPFGIEILSTEFYEINGSDWDDKWIETENLSDIGKKYIMTSNRNSGWASRYVVGEVKLATGLSEVTVDYRYQDMTGKYTESGEATGDLAYSELYEDKSSKAGGYVLMNKKTAWVVFSNANTKDIQVALGAKTNVYKISNIGNEPDITTSVARNENGIRFYIRQDVSNPIIESIFLSLKNNYNEAKENKLLTFNAITEDPQNPNYYFVLDTDAAASPKYNSAKNFIYTAEKVYVYIKVTDKPGALAGSGVTNVTFGGKKCGQAATEGSSTYYVTTNATYGYLRTGTGEDTPSYNINVSDQQNNSCSASFGHSVYKPEQVNKDGGKITVTGTAEYRALPVVDSYHPYIALTATNENGYLSVSGETASDDDEVVTNVNYFKGEPIKNTSFYAELTFRVGISGLTLYTRRKAIDDTSRLD